MRSVLLWFGMELGMKLIIRTALLAQLLISAPSVILAENTILKAQRFLNILGYDAGAVDGLYGGKTKLALEEFYSDRNQSYDGQLDQQDIVSLLELGFSAAAADKSPSYETLNVLPRRSENFDARPCNYEDNFSFSDIETIILENDYSEIDANSENEQGFLYINNRVAMFLSELWATPTENNANKVKKLFGLLFKEEFALKPKDNSHKDSLAVKEFLISLIYVLSVLEQNELIDPSEKLTFLSEIQKRFEAIQNATRWGFEMSSCEVGKDLFGCQNHTYGHQYTRTLYGSVFNSSVDYMMGKRLYQFAISDLSQDGSMWREASRGKWSWRYYGHALGYLLSIAEIYRLNDEDLYSFRADTNGLTIHDAVSFYLKAVQDPQLMWEYSSQLEGVKGRKDYKNFKSDEYLKQVIEETERGGTKNWYYIYRAQFPDHPNTILGDKLIPTFKKQISSTNNIGYLAQCVYKLPFQKTSFTAISPSNDNKLGELAYYKSNASHYFLKNSKHKVNLQESEVKVAYDNSSSALISGDVLFYIDNKKYSSWIDIEFGRENPKNGDVTMFWSIEEYGAKPFSHFYDGFEAAKKECGIFNEAPSDMLVIHFKTADKGKLEKQNCYLDKIQKTSSKYAFAALTNLLESSAQLMRLIIEDSPALKELDGIDLN